MDADKKLGFALGILLCGIVGAFFFRDESESNNKQPDLVDASKLDQRIRQKAQTPYLPDREPDELGDVPNALVSDVMPQIPGSEDLVAQGPAIIPEPIRPSSPQDSEVDRVTPVPGPSSDAQFDAAFDRVNLRNNRTGISAQESVRPRLSQQAPSDVKDGGLSPIAQLDELPGATSVNKTDSPRNSDKAKNASRQWIVHEVVAGDTLSEIASKYLGSARRYREVFQYNKDQLKSADDLKLGMKLRIPSSNARPAHNQTNVPTTPAMTPTVDSPLSLTPGSPLGTGPAKAGPPTKSPLPQGPLFVRPPKTRLSPVPRITQAPGGSLRQTPPPDVPHVDGLLDPTVIATRLKADTKPRRAGDETARD